MTVGRDVRVHWGDCLHAMRELGDGTIESVVCDPPYGINYRNKKKSKLQAPIVNDQRPFIWWMWEAARVLRDGGCMVCFCRWDVQEVFRQSIELAGLVVRSQWVWDRVQHGMGDCKATLAPRHDVMWFATKGRFAFHGGRPKSIIAAPSVHGASRVHPTEKPASLMRELVQWVTPGGGTVLDPCMGSGATGECVRDGYRFVGVEIDGKYFGAALKRLRGIVSDEET